MPAQQAESFHDARCGTGSRWQPCETLSEATLRRVAEEALLRVARMPLTLRHATPMPANDEVDALCTALLQPGLSATWQFLDRLRAEGRTPSEIVLGHFPEAARRLGDMWNRDEVSFIQVGQGAGQLQRLVRTLRPETTGRRRDPARRALFATLPGETHTLGVVIAADACRQRGWEVDLSFGDPREGFLAALSEGTYPVLGLSLGSQRSRTELESLLPEIRVVAPGTRVLLSGPLVATSTLIARQIPADAWAGDIDAALEVMETLLAPAEKAATA